MLKRHCGRLEIERRVEYWV